MGPFRMFMKWAAAFLLCLALHPCAAQDLPTRRVLFLCTGNFFRSVYAEQYFNALSERNQRLGAQDPARKPVRWVAESRGLDVAQLSAAQRAARISRYTLERLKKRNIALNLDPATRLPAHLPRQVTLADLEGFDRVIAMHEPTHRAMLRKFLEKHKEAARDPEALAGRVVYWDIPDVVPGPVIPMTEAQQADRALDAIEAGVERLFAGL